MPLTAFGYQHNFLASRGFDGRDSHLRRTTIEDADTSMFFGCVPSIESECIVADTEACAIAVVAAAASEM